MKYEEEKEEDEVMYMVERENGKKSDHSVSKYFFLSLN